MIQPRQLIPLAGILASLATPLMTTHAQETDAARDTRMQWWREAKFGLFIHWGVYAVPAGVYRDKEIPGIGEWIMRNAEIPAAEYRAFAEDFNPVAYDPEAWAALAADAGMRYIVITSKHHDGFALFPSAATDWDIADATPYGQDLIGPLAAAARNHGLKFGLYYSQAQDWTHPGGAKARLKEGESWDEATKGDFDAYLRDIAIPQTREILTRYQPDILWWDTPTWMNEARAKPLRDLLALRPGIITNNRLGGGFKGDTETPEQHVPATGFPGRDWETCMTMNDTWGFKSHDHDWKSTATLLTNLVDIVSKGGNYLLNIGPTSEGVIPAESIERLREIGAWMRVNGDAIHGTTASPFHKLTWGRATKKTTDGRTTLFLHVFDWPADGKLVVPGLRSTIASARLLATGAKVKARATGHSVTLDVPREAPDPIVSVIALALRTPLEVGRILPSADKSGAIALSAAYADIHNNIRAHTRLAGRGDDARVTDWKNASSTVSWDFEAARPGDYAVTATIAGMAANKLALVLGGQTTPAEIAAAGTDAAREARLGTIHLPAAGAHTLELKPDAETWTGLELMSLRLTPVE